MKNIPKYEIRFKQGASGRIRSYKKEVKLAHLYCYACHDYKTAKQFPHESGYGSKAQRSTCAVCLNKRAIHNRDKLKRTTRNKYNIKDQTYQHYGGYKCSVGGSTQKEILVLHHVHFNGKECRIEACGTSYQYNSTVYQYWLRRNHYPEKHRQIVVCINQHCLIHKKQHEEKKHRRVKKVRQHKRVALTDKEKLLDMFGLTKDDLEDSD